MSREHITYRLAIVASHPVQYQGPWFRKLAADPEIDLTVLFACDHGTRPAEDAEFGVSFAWDQPLTEGYDHVFMRNAHPRPSPWGFWTRTNPELWNRIRDGRFDAVVVFGWGFASAWIAVAAAKAHGAKVFMYGDSTPERQGRPLWKKVVRSAVLRSLFRKVDAFLAVGALNRRLYELHGAPADRIFKAPFSVDSEFFESQRECLRPKRPALRVALGVHDDRPIILFAGKLVEGKAPLDLLRAFGNVRRQMPAVLVYLGDGELRGAIEREAERLGLSDDVVVTGFRNHGDLGSVYAAADLLVLPSRAEAWGLVVNEAMVFGLPVVCSEAVGAHHDLVIPNVTGAVFRVHDIHDLGEKLLTCLRDPEHLHEMGAAAQQHIQAWTYEHCVAGIREALRATVTPTLRPW